MNWPRVATICVTLSLLIASAIGVAHIKERLARTSLVDTTKRADISITIVEGKRREEIAHQLAAAGITDYGDFMAESTNLEGMLFPDTYRFFPATPARDVVKKLEDTYLSRTLDTHVDENTLILASIVEREARSDDERALIAGVYANRLAKGMNLEADPTVQYAKDTQGYEKAGQIENYTFWEPILQADYRSVQSDFNTYLHGGLPPAPICNPGIKSIEAAANPAKHGYYYFFQARGKLYLSKTLDEHLSKLRTTPQ